MQIFQILCNVTDYHIKPKIQMFMPNTKTVFSYTALYVVLRFPFTAILPFITVKQLKLSSKKDYLQLEERT